MATSLPTAETVSFIGADDITLRGDRWEAPDRKGTVVLLHGGGQTRHSWHKAGERISAAGWTTLSMDARGHGDSGWSPDGKYDHNKLSADLLAIIDGLEDPPVLVGASMGGVTSLVTAGENPGVARALVLVDIVPKVEKAGSDRIIKFMLGAPDGFANLEEVAAAIHAYNPHRSRPASLEGLRKNVRQQENGRWYWHWDPAFMRPESGADEATRALGYQQLLNAARNLEIPALLVRGKQSDIVSMEGVREFLDVIKDSRYVDISDAGHMVAGDDNDVFTTAVLDFLADV